MTEVDADVATKAPESAAQEHHGPTTPGATPDAAAPATQAPDSAPPKMGDECHTDRPTPSGEGPTGEIRTLNDIDVYISKPSEYPHAPARLLLLLTGGTGLASTNNQLQADKFAAAGYVVVMPDLFGGDVAPNSTPAPAESTPGGSLLDSVKTKAAETAKSFLIDMWLARHTDATVAPVLRRVLAGARDEFADAVARGGGVYAVGYCFGGRYVLQLAAGAPAAAADDDPAGARRGPGPCIRAGALAHATLVARDDFAGVAAPLSLVCVADDPLFPDDVRAFGEDSLKRANVEHEVRVYPGVPHGFAVVGDYKDATIQEAQRTAHAQILNWLNDH